MKVVSIKRENPREDGVFKIEFSDGVSILFSVDYLSEQVIPGSWNQGSAKQNSLDHDSPEEGRDLSVSEEEELRFAADCYKAEKVALSLIARAEQSKLRLTAKLEKKGIGNSVTKAVIHKLLERGLLDDERYAELWVRSCLARKTPSPLWLLVSLGKRGIDRDSSHNAIKKVLDEETEYSLLLNYIDKMDDLEKEKGLRSLLKYEGFSPETLNRFFDTQ